MKKVIALLLALIMISGCLPALAEDGRVEAACEMAQRMAVLAANTDYVDLFVDKQEGLEEELAMMAACADADVTGTYIYNSIAFDAVDKLTAEYYTDTDGPVSDELIVLEQMNSALPQLLMNISGGWLWQQLTNCLSVTSVLPADSVKPGFVFLDYGLSCGVMVTFTECKNGIAAQAYYMQSELFTSDIASDWLGTLWQKEE